MTPQEVLSAAADHMEEVGLYKGDFYDSDDMDDMYACCPLLTEVVEEARNKSCCALGAIYAVVPTRFTRARVDIEPLVDRATGLLVGHLGVHSVNAIPDWNDAPERTQEEVVAALRAAARLEENA